MFMIQITDKRKKVDNLLDEQFEIEHKILDDLKTLINASWDSNTVKLRLEGLMKEQDQIYEELTKFNEKD